MNDPAAPTSPFIRPPEPITASDDELRDALAEAELQPLLPALAYLTGDLSLLRPHLRPDPLLVSQPDAGFTPEQQTEIRAIALEALAAFRDAGSTPAPLPSDTDVLRIMEFAAGENDMADYLPLLEEELAHGGTDPRAPGWHLDDVAAGREFTVLVIGAGMSGLLAAHRLDQAGVDWVVVDKNDDVGGTWLENTYPGCRVDNPNHNYSYSFAQRHDWPFHYSPQEVLLDYFRDCADAWGIRDRVRYGTEVRRATWDDDIRRWRVDVVGPDGSEALTVNAVISAVGQLNRPLVPDIAGLDDFAGPCFHSGAWDHDVDLSGKRVAVIGTGASAVQFVPEIAERCGSLTVFQRTPPWMGPTADYHDPIGPGLRWLLDNVSGYAEWNRFCIFWRMGDGALAAVRVDPEFDGGPGAVSEVSAFMRAVLTDHITTSFAARPDLATISVPDYPVGAKRVLRDNGAWPHTLMRDDVAVVTTPIDHVAPDGIVDTDGEHRPFDVIVLGTGFQASRFLTPMAVTGVDGLDLHEHWDGDARAYLGVTIGGSFRFFGMPGSQGGEMPPGFEFHMDPNRFGMPLDQLPFNLDELPGNWKEFHREFEFHGPPGADDDSL